MGRLTSDPRTNVNAHHPMVWDLVSIPICGSGCSLSGSVSTRIVPYVDDKGDRLGVS